MRTGTVALAVLAASLGAGGQVDQSLATTLARRLDVVVPRVLEATGDGLRHLHARGRGGLGRRRGLRWPRMAALQVGSPAPDAELLGEGDRRVRLSELWSRQPLVLVFLRHFG